MGRCREILASRFWKPPPGRYGCSVRRGLLGLLLPQSVGKGKRRQLQMMRVRAAELMAGFRSSVPGSGLLNCLRSK